MAARLLLFLAALAALPLCPDGRRTGATPTRRASAERRGGQGPGVAGASLVQGASPKRWAALAARLVPPTLGVLGATTLAREFHRSPEQAAGARPRRWVGGTLTVKVLTERSGSDEVNIMTALAGPRFVADGGEAPDGSRRLVLEGSSGTLYDRVVRAESTVSLHTKLQLLADLLRALQRMHESGFVHRDISPHNLHVFDDCVAPGTCRLKVGGFGSICSIIGVIRPCGAQEPARASLYTAPEALRGDAAEDPKRDVFSAGVVAYAMLLGHPPVANASARIVQDDPVKPLREQFPELADLFDLLEKMTAASPEERCSATEALQALTFLAEGLGMPIVEDGPQATGEGSQRIIEVMPARRSK